MLQNIGHIYHLVLTGAVIVIGVSIAVLLVWIATAWSRGRIQWPR